MWSITCYLVDEIRNISGFVKQFCQVYDVSTFANTEIIPLVTLGVYLERSMVLLTKGRKIPQVVTLLLGGRISQTRKKILQLYRFYFLYIHIIMKLEGLKN